MARKVRVQYPGAIYHVMNRRDRLFAEWGIPMDSPAGWEQFAGQMEARRRAEGAGKFEPKGSCLSGEELRHEPLAQASELASPRHAGEEIRESALAKAQRIAATEWAALGWTVKDLQGRRSCDPQKVRTAARLRRETTMTLEWITKRKYNEYVYMDPNLQGTRQGTASLQESSA
jgi:hypothetical protein